MPALEVSDCTLDAVLWSKVGNDRQNELIVDYPKGVRVRWTERTGFGTDARGDQLAIDVSAAVACCEVPLGSLMWLGGMDALPGTADPPEPTSDIYQAMTRSQAYDVKGRLLRTEVGLKRYTDRMPTVINSLEDE